MVRFEAISFSAPRIRAIGDGERQKISQRRELINSSCAVLQKKIFELKLNISYITLKDTANGAENCEYIYLR